MCKDAFISSTKHGRLFLPHMESALKPNLPPLEAIASKACERLCEAGLALTNDSKLFKHLSGLAEQGSHLHTRKHSPAVLKKHAMVQERLLSSLLNLILMDILGLGTCHQFCLGTDGTHADGVGVPKEDLWSRSAINWRIRFLMECKRNHDIVGGDLTPYYMRALYQLANQWHRIATVFNASAVVAFLTDEVGMVAYVISESNEYFRAAYTALLTPYATATVVEASIKRLGVSAILGSAEWSDEDGVKRLMQQCLAAIATMNVAALSPLYRGPTLPRAVMVDLQLGLAAAQALLHGVAAAAGTAEADTDPSHYRLQAALSVCTSQWINTETKEKFVVKVYDHSASGRRPPAKELLEALIDAAFKLENEAVYQFYRSWRVTEIGPGVAILTYRWLDMGPVSVENVVTMLKLYRLVFATPRRLSASEAVESVHCHGDSLRRNFEPPALLDLDFVSVEYASYHPSYSRVTLPRHPAVACGAASLVELSHDLWGFGVALTEGFPARSGAHKVGKWLKAECSDHSRTKQSLSVLDDTISRLQRLPEQRVANTSPPSSSPPSTAPTLCPDQLQGGSPEAPLPVDSTAPAAGFASFDEGEEDRLTQKAATRSSLV